MKRAERRTPARGPQVLVVDDEPDIRELLELTLVKMGLGVASAGTIAEAKERLKGEHYELCLTDMRLPDGEGLELVRYIAASANDLPVAVITAHGSAENAVAALKAGAFDYVSKPSAWSNCVPWCARRCPFPRRRRRRTSSCSARARRWPRCAS